MVRGPECFYEFIFFGEWTSRLNQTTYGKSKGTYGRKTTLSSGLYFFEIFKPPPIWGKIGKTREIWTFFWAILRSLKNGFLNIFRKNPLNNVGREWKNIRFLGGLGLALEIGRPLADVKGASSFFRNSLNHFLFHQFFINFHD